MANYISRWKRPFRKSNFLSILSKYRSFISDMKKYKNMAGTENFSIKDTYPCLFDKKANTSVNSQYFYQDVWAFKNIYTQKPAVHVDVGSNVNWVSLVTVITKVQFIDIRPLDAVDLKNIECIKGNILEMPFEDNTVNSLSCLNVAEHIGLGRYGDPLDPMGTKKAAQELKRVLAPSGNLLFSLPVGKPRCCFNAHRIHSPLTILDYFDGLTLREFSCADDNNRFIENADPKALAEAKFACGLFWFTKE